VQAAKRKMRPAGLLRNFKGPDWLKVSCRFIEYFLCKKDTKSLFSCRPGLPALIPDKGQVLVRHNGPYANAPIRPSPGVDVRGREAASGLCLRASRPDDRGLAVLRETHYRLHECGRRDWAVRIKAPRRGERPVSVRPGFRASPPDQPPAAAPELPALGTLTLG
jgi:hypothetical protein